MKGNVFNIQHYTIHDGPGIRTELFLKGCSLSCRWCSNPEGIGSNPQPGIYKTRCISRGKCGLCLQACREANDGGIVPLSFYRGKPVIDRSTCKGCLACAKACPADAIKEWGRYYTTGEVMEEILRDRGRCQVVVEFLVDRAQLKMFPLNMPWSVPYLFSRT